MHIVIVTPYFPPDISGAGAYLADIATTALADGHRITVLHQGPVAGATVDGVRIESVESRVRGMTSVASVAAALRLHRRDRVDLFVAGLAYPVTVPLGVVSRLTRVPMLVTAFSEELATADRSGVVRRLLRFGLGSARVVVAISTATLSNVVRLGARRERCDLIPPSIDPQPYVAAATADRRRATRERLGLGDRRVVLTVARLEDRKGHDVVLRALASLVDELPDLHYLVVGQGDQSRLRELAAAAGMAERLTILYDVDRRDLVDTYAAADLFVMTSRAGEQGDVDGFGIVYLEAAACGLPCVAGNLGGCPDAVEDGVTGFVVDPTDAGAVANAIREVLVDPARAGDLGDRGRRRVLDEFSRDAFAQKFTAVLRAVAPDVAAAAVD